MENIVSGLTQSGEAAPQQQSETLEITSTHVLVPQEQVLRLRELSRKTRVAQSEYLREAVDDLLEKYGPKEEPKE